MGAHPWHLGLNTSFSTKKCYPRYSEYDFIKIAMADFDFDKSVLSFHLPIPIIPISSLGTIKSKHFIVF